MAEKFPSWKQALITFFGGIVLAGTSCFGFVLSIGGNLEGGSGNEALAMITAIAFCASLLAILVGFIFIIMRALRGASEKRPPQSPEFGSPGSPGSTL